MTPHPSEKSFAEGLRAAVAARGLSLDRIRYHLRQRGHDLSIATLSYWQSGRSHPDRAASLAALGSLEEILGVPRASLAALLPPTKRLPEGLSSAATLSLSPIHDAGRRLDELIAELGMTWSEGLRRVSMHDVLVVAEDRSIIRHASHDLHIATQNGVASRAVGHVWPPGVRDFRLEPTLNCTIGRIVEDLDQGVQVVELLFSRTLSEGESIVTEYRRVAPLGVDFDTYWERGFAVGIREVVFEVRFAPTMLPARIEVYKRAQDGSEIVRRLSAEGGTATAIWSDVGTEVVGIRWEWGDS